jgi:hypothetical protein
MKENWNIQIQELEAFFSSAKLPKKEIIVNDCVKIVNIKSFINNHLEVVKANNGSPYFRPYLDRLIYIKNQI